MNPHRPNQYNHHRSTPSASRNRFDPYYSKKSANTRKSQAHCNKYSAAKMLLMFAGIILVLAVSGFSAVLLVLALANNRLPSLDALIDYRPRIPLKIYTLDKKLIAEFGQERRTFVRIRDVPQHIKNAILSAEDSRFFDHIGIDLIGIFRAGMRNFISGETEQGASTLTMQLARDFFLSPERTYTRKIFEILLSLQIEKKLTKEQILELYINQIYLGKHAYGLASAAKLYFRKSLSELTTAQAAVLAGLPKAPSRFNPIVNPKRAIERQRYILHRMYDNGFLSERELEKALTEPLQFASSLSAQDEYPVYAPYIGELVRRIMVKQYQNAAYTSGLSVYTTILSKDQDAANKSIKSGVIKYTQRNGFRGPEKFLDLPHSSDAAEGVIAQTLKNFPDTEGFQAAVVLAVSPKSVVLSRGNGKKITLSQEGLDFVKGALKQDAPAAIRLRRGAVVRIIRHKTYEITQLPTIQAALVSLNTQDGSIRALVGGFDFEHNQFNRVTQALRQPGSSFKPFIYSAALEKGFTPTSKINDAPISFGGTPQKGPLWEPKNYNSRYEGPIPLHLGFAKSKNVVSVRVLHAIGTHYAQQYISRFGFRPAQNPPYLTMALGAGLTTPWQMAGAISVFANGGYRVEPYFIDQITDANGTTIFKANQPRASNGAKQVIDPRNAFIMDSLLREVTKSGTGARAQATLKRGDIAGKTGTTNNAVDAWFVGYQPKIAAVTWLGFDQPKNLGNRQTGGTLALPIWIEYMESVLKNIPEEYIPIPSGVIARDGHYYYQEIPPEQSRNALDQKGNSVENSSEDSEEVLVPPDISTENSETVEGRNN